MSAIIYYTGARAPLRCATHWLQNSATDNPLLACCENSVRHIGALRLIHLAGTIAAPAFTRPLQWSA